MHLLRATSKFDTDSYWSSWEDQNRFIKIIDPEPLFCLKRMKEFLKRFQTSISTVDFYEKLRIKLLSPSKLVLQIWNNLSNELFQEKNKQEGSWGHTFLKKALEFEGFLLYTQKFQTRKGLPLKILENCVALLGSSKGNIKTPGNFFLFTPGNSNLFLVNSWKFNRLFIHYP